MSAEGGQLFARYAYPPNELGYCGPDDAAALLRASDVEQRARLFDGAWCYLEFIAESAGIPDPLDRRVVEAYWVGNDLLDHIDPRDLMARLHLRFRTQTGGTWRTAGDEAVAHHSFHVFRVYPWTALLSRSGNPTALSIVDRCRIRVGEVLHVAAETAIVESRPLAWEDGALLPSTPRLETARWSAGGRSLIPTPEVGDRVALHWEWICDTLTDAQCARLEALEVAQR
jgi:Family of unknown function (DUF6390)